VIAFPVYFDVALLLGMFLLTTSLVTIYFSNAKRNPVLVNYLFTCARLAFVRLLRSAEGISRDHLLRFLHPARLRGMAAAARSTLRALPRSDCFDLFGSATVS
jgi:hypothetical protein